MATLTSSALAARRGESRDLMTTCIDTGSSHHMSPFMATGRGNLRVEIPNDKGKTSPIILRDMLYAPGMAFTLLSVPRADKNGCAMSFRWGRATIRNRDDHQIGCVPLTARLYTFTSPRRVPLQANVATSRAVALTPAQLHRRLGHIGTRQCKELVRKGLVHGITLVPAADGDEDGNEQCEACMRAKIHRTPFPQESSTPRATNYGGRCHTDVWGPAQTLSIGGALYFSSYLIPHS